MHTAVSFHLGRSYRIHSPLTLHTTYTEKLQFGISNFAKSFSPLQHSKQLSRVFWFCFVLGKNTDGLDGKGLPAMWQTQVRPLGLEDPLDKETATHASILAWRTPWTEEPCGLQSMGS